MTASSSSRVAAQPWGYWWHSTGQPRAGLQQAGQEGVGLGTGGLCLLGLYNQQ